MFRARNIQFEVAERTQAICYGGIGLMHSLARESGLIEAAGVDNTILGSDLGQEGNCWPVKGFRNVICLCLSLGYDEADIKAMIGANPAKLLDLDPLD